MSALTSFDFFTEQLQKGADGHPGRRNALHQTERGASAEAVRGELVSVAIPADTIRMFDDIASALSAARDEAGEADRIVVFGSFLTVAAALASAKPETGREPRNG